MCWWRPGPHLLACSFEPLPPQRQLVLSPGRVEIAPYPSQLSVHCGQPSLTDKCAVGTDRWTRLFCSGRGNKGSMAYCFWYSRQAEPPCCLGMNLLLGIQLRISPHSWPQAADPTVTCVLMPSGFSGHQCQNKATKHTTDPKASQIHIYTRAHTTATATTLGTCSVPR